LVSEKESEIRLLTRGIEKAEEKVDSLRKELTQRNSTVESLQTTIQSQRGEMSSVKELKEQLKDAEALKTEAEKQMEEIQEKYYSLVKKTQKLETQVGQLKTKIQPAPQTTPQMVAPPATQVSTQPKKFDQPPLTQTAKTSTATATSAALPQTPTSQLAADYSGIKRKSPDREEDAWRRMRTYTSTVSTTDQRPPIGARLKPRVEPELTSLPPKPQPLAEKQQPQPTQAPEGTFTLFLLTCMNHLLHPDSFQSRNLLEAAPSSKEVLEKHPGVDQAG